MRRQAVVAQNSFAWTNGRQSIYFGHQDAASDEIIELLRELDRGHDDSAASRQLVQLLRGIRHLYDNTSHDIITYDDYLQPPLGQLLCSSCIV